MMKHQQNKRTKRPLSLRDIQSSITAACVQDCCSIEYDRGSIILQAISKKLTEKFVELSYFKHGVIYNNPTNPFNNTKRLRLTTANIAAVFVLRENDVTISCYVTDLDVYGMDLYDRDAPSVVKLAEPQFFDIIYNIIDQFIQHPSVNIANDRK